ncbi:hypothetical protein ACFQRC_04395 [Enterovirga sp. GCM10030262]|uniref:hypothetical protein n=1 Tax=Enterovirga sp. GCM10030262 TaxID=3273391 RepID=UPI0036224FA6
MSNINELLKDLDQKRALCESLYAQIDGELAEDREVDELIAGFESAIREYEDLQSTALRELLKLEGELKEWGEQSRA